MCAQFCSHHTGEHIVKSFTVEYAGFAPLPSPLWYPNVYKNKTLLSIAVFKKH